LAHGITGTPKTPSLLRQQAEYCRRLAAGITNDNVRRRLLALATELDKQAATLKPKEVVAQPRRRR
jgi:hypothetical protein